MGNTRADAPRIASTYDFRAKPLTHGQHPSPARHVLPFGLARELRAARRSRGLGLRAAAAKLGVDPGYLSRLERGLRCPSIAVAQDLAAGLDLESDVAGRLFDAARPDAGRSWRPARDPP
jgi:DNA-binding XRE family transcriptional regulator